MTEFVTYAVLPILSVIRYTIYENLAFRNPFAVLGMSQLVPYMTYRNPYQYYNKRAVSVLRKETNIQYIS